MASAPRPSRAASRLQQAEETSALAPQAPVPSLSGSAALSSTATPAPPPTSATNSSIRTSRSRELPSFSPESKPPPLTSPAPAPPPSEGAFRLSGLTPQGVCASARRSEEHTSALQSQFHL